MTLDQDFKYCIDFLSASKPSITKPTTGCCRKCGSYNILHEYLSNEPFYIVCSDCGVMEDDNISRVKEYKDAVTSVNRISLPYSRKVYLKRKIRYRIGIQNVSIPIDLIKTVREHHYDIKEIRAHCSGELKRYKRHAHRIYNIAYGKAMIRFPERLFEHLCFFLCHFERYYSPANNKKKFISVDYFALKLMQWMHAKCDHKLLGYDPSDYRFIFKRAICQVTKDRNFTIWRTVDSDHIFSHFLSVYGKNAKKDTT